MNIDVNSLLNGSSSTSSRSLFDTSALLQPLIPFIVVITVVSVLITILYVMNVINTWRSHRATIEMRDILREMNERDKAHDTTPANNTTHTS